MSYFRENIEKLQGYTPGYQPAEQEQVVKLNTNENPWPPSPAVMQAIRGIEAEKLRKYPDPLGNKFREAAAKLNGVEPENIMCCNGGDDLLTIAFRAFCDEARPVAYPVPTYTLYSVLASLQNCPKIEAPFDEQYDLPARLSQSKAALTIVCNPNAPSGSLVDKAELAELAAEIKGVLLIDEAYVDYAGDDCVDLVKQFDNVIILRSMSKGYSLAGLRFGYAIAPFNLIEGLMKVKDSYNVDAVAIEAAAAAIEDQSYFKENIKKIKTERQRLTDELRRIGFQVAESSANFLLATSTNPPAERIYEQLAERNIYVRYFPLPKLNDKIRISIGRADQNDKLLMALEEIVAK